MEDALMEATGINGRVLLFKDVVRIKRIGIGSFLSGASKNREGHPDLSDREHTVQEGRTAQQRVHGVHPDAQPREARQGLRI